MIELTSFSQLVEGDCFVILDTTHSELIQVWKVIIKNESITKLMPMLAPTRLLNNSFELPIGAKPSKNLYIVNEKELLAFMIQKS